MSQNRRHLRGFDFYMDVWHRADHLGDFVGRQRASWMSLIDIDACEYCNLCYEAVALIETKNCEATSKATTVTQKLAKRSDVPAYLVEYQLAHPIAQCDTCGHPTASDGQDIVSFWVTDLVSNERRQVLPTDYAEWLWDLRKPHWRRECLNPAKARMLDFPAEHVMALEYENRALRYLAQGQQNKGAAS